MLFAVRGGARGQEEKKDLFFGRGGKSEGRNPIVGTPLPPFINGGLNFQNF